MGLLQIASIKSFWRGYEYYQQGKVLTSTRLEKGLYSGKVAGSGVEIYDVTIDTDHPKKSVCSCLLAEGTRRICRHKVALYCSLFPAEAEKIVKSIEHFKEMEEKYRKQKSKGK